MPQTSSLLETLRRLNDLEGREAPYWVKQLSPDEKARAIEGLRERLPTALLGHHEHMLAHGKRSLASVRQGVCGACFHRLSSEPHSGRRSAPDLDVCDHCGVFLERAEEPSGLEKPPATSSTAERTCRPRPPVE